MPAWLKIILLAVGLIIGGAFLIQLALVIGRGRRKAATPAAQPRTACSDQGPGSGCLAEDRARIALAYHDRLVVTHSKAAGPQTLRYRASMELAYVVALLLLMEYARASDDRFTYEPMCLEALRDQGLLVSGPRLDGVRKVLAEIPGLYLSDD